LFTQLFAFGEVIDFFKQPAADWMSYAIAISGALYYVALGRSVSKIGEFERDDGDFAALAAKAAMTGMYGEALKFIDRMQEPGKEGLKVAALINASAGNTERAEAYARRYLAVIDVDPTPGYLFAILSGGVAALPSSKESALELVKRAIAEKVSDVVMMDVIRSLLATKRIDAVRMLEEFKTKGDEGDHPLAFCYLKWFVNEETDILDFFDEKGEGLKGAHRMLWLTMHTLVRMFILEQEQRIAAIQEWNEKRLPELESLNGEVEDSIEKLSILGVLLQFMQIVASSGVGGWEPIRGVAKQIEASVAVNEVTVIMLRWMSKLSASGQK
jgi:hypothetical protein